MLFGCHLVQNLWTQVVRFLQEAFRIEDISLGPQQIIFNEIVSKKYHVANFVCLITKQYVYRARCLGEELHFPTLKAIIKRIENIEKFIAVKNNKVGHHQAKWCCEIQQVVDLNYYIDAYIQDL